MKCFRETNLYKSSPKYSCIFTTL